MRATTLDMVWLAGLSASTQIELLERFIAEVRQDLFAAEVLLREAKEARRAETDNKEV